MLLQFPQSSTPAGQLTQSAGPLADDPVARLLSLRHALIYRHLSPIRDADKIVFEVDGLTPPRRGCFHRGSVGESRNNPRICLRSCAVLSS